MMFLWISWESHDMESLIRYTITACEIRGVIYSMLVRMGCDYLEVPEMVDGCPACIDIGWWCLLVVALDLSPTTHSNFYPISHCDASWITLEFYEGC